MCRKPVQQQQPVLRPTPQGQVRVALLRLQYGLGIGTTCISVPLVAGGGTLPTGFSAVRPPTPAEVAEAEKSFQLAVQCKLFIVFMACR